MFQKATIASFSIAQLNSKTKGYHVYGYKYTVSEELTCTVDDGNLSYIIDFLFYVNWFLRELVWKNVNIYSEIFPIYSIYHLRLFLK